MVGWPTCVTSYPHFPPPTSYCHTDRFKISTVYVIITVKEKIHITSNFCAAAKFDTIENPENPAHSVLQGAYSRHAVIF